MLTPARCVSLLLVVADAAQAASQLWQPRITRYDHLADIGSNHTLMRRTLDELTDPSPIDARSIDKRYLIRTLDLMQPWPNHEVRYCFATPEDKQALFYNLKDAIDRWWWAGLDQSVYKWTEVDDNECQSHRSTLLLIKRGRDGAGHTTTTGYIPADSSTGSEGPVMILDDTDWGGYDNKVGTFAHEIGHAWGLFHEHQNPNFWRSEDGFVDANFGTVFGNDNFHCENLVGYDTALAAAQADLGPEGGKAICKSVATAGQYHFAADAFLPWTPSIVFAPPGHNFADVDFTSIMIYPSHTSSSNGLPVITAPGGAIIVQNHYPTAQDVIGINLVYTTPIQNLGPFLNQAGNSQFNSFQSLYKQSRGEKGC
ncbi:Metallopeptidase, catalytic domain protein [Akanthomyces lecanii RCEF 1005]|uniref:Metallopeptidase, catalytic domain protein n=1 Tax=Akanthomyces lecanii RCEF 1005 TaxID=1081108 RepID=A0A162JWW2_CORDF|nr:Metallopeptidase, catalytic domain protein [Akanthomyces lecanii RCEF 1005]